MNFAVKTLATILWIPMVVVVASLAVVGGLFVTLAAALIPATRYVAKMGDE